MRLPDGNMPFKRVLAAALRILVGLIIIGSVSVFVCFLSNSDHPDENCPLLMLIAIPFFILVINLIALDLLMLIVYKILKIQQDSKVVNWIWIWLVVISAVSAPAFLLDNHQPTDLWLFGIMGMGSLLLISPLVRFFLLRTRG